MATLANRNNNPGNLRDPSTGSFRQFGSPQEGYAALLNDLQGKMTGTTTTGLGPYSTLIDFAKVYAPASDNNNPGQYAANLANKMKVRPDATLQQLKPQLGQFADAIAQNEGYQSNQPQQFFTQNQPSATNQFFTPPTINPSTPPSVPSVNTLSSNQLSDGSNADTYGATFPASQGDNPAVAGLKALGNVPSSIYNMGKGLVNTAIHPFQTGKGVLDTIAGGVETGLNKLFGQNVQDQQTHTFESVMESLKNRYGGLDNLQRTATNDPAGFGADVLTLLEGGTSGLDAVAGTNSNAALNRGLEAVAHPIAEGVKKVATLPFRLAGETAGIDTGAGYGSIKEGYQSTANGGNASKAFNDALSGNTDPETLVQKAKDALGEVVGKRRSTYQDALSKISGDSTTYDISPVNDELQNQLQKFNIRPDGEGGLDFSRSSIRFDSTSQNAIQNIYDTMKNYGTVSGDRTAVGLDNLKQAFGDLYSPSSSVRSFTSSMTKAVRGVLSDVPGYDETMTTYGDMTDQIQQIQKGLSLGDKASIDTAFRKLISSLRQNNEFRTALVQDLDKATGGTLLPSIAGQQLSPLLPRGLAGTIEGIGGIGAAVANPSIILPLIGAAITTSPQVVGRFIQALGLGTRATNAVMSIVNKIAPVAGAIGNASNRLNTVDNQSNTQNE